MVFDIITPSGLTILIVAIAAFIAVFYFLKVVKYLIVNSVIGLILLFVSKFVIGVLDLGFNIDINLVSILICAIGGVPGVLIVVLLGFLGIPLA